MRNYVNETGTRANKRQKKYGRVNVLAILISVSMICSLMVPYAQFIEASSDLPNCGKVEHRHDASCYRLDHTPSCGKAAGEDHTHTDACYDKVLACVKEEHTHMDACYSDKNADVEDPAMWDAQFGTAALTKDTWAESLAAVAEKQVGYEESEDNYEVEKDGSHNGYTRYGDFADDTYGSWDTSFVNFCLEYAGIAEADVFPKEETDAEKWQKEFVKDEKQNKTYIADTNKEDYTPQVGDIVFIEGNKENGNDKDDTTMGIVTDVNKKKDEITVVEGDSHDQVEENTYDADDKHITDAIQMDQVENDVKAEEAAGSDEQAAADTAQPEGDKGTEAADPSIEDTDNAEADKEEGSDAITTEDPTEPTSVYICGKEEHKHGDACYDEQGELTCKQEEHQHGLDCLRPAEDEEQPAEEPSEEQQPEQTEPQYFCNKEEHRHGDSCLDEKGAIICGKEGHQHDESCLQDPAAETPEQEEPQYFCNKEEHKHIDACYSSKMQEVMEKGNSLFQSMMQTFGAQNQDETPQLSGEKVLICGKEEHQHDESCLQEEEKMISLETQVDGTTISLSGPESSFEKGKQYTLQAEKIENKEDVAAVEKAIREAAAKEEKTVESYQAFDITLLADGQKVQPLGPVEVTFSGGETAEFASETDDVSILHIDEETGTARDMSASAAADNSLVVEATHFSPYVCVKMARQADEETSDEIPEYAAAVPVKEGGYMALKLRYGDWESDASAKPNGEEPRSPHYDVSGYVFLYPVDIPEDAKAKDVVVTLHVPKEYIKKDSISFGKLSNEHFSDIECETFAVEETDTTYDLKIRFGNYPANQELGLDFHMAYPGGIVPAGYTLKITATIERDDKDDVTQPNLYPIKYGQPTITKYVNTNQYDNMSEDETKVSASVDKDGNMAQDQYVSFWYKMGGSEWDLREYEKVILTDTLPHYKDKAGTDRIARFDPDKNPGWILSEDGKTVQYTVTTDKTCLEAGDTYEHWKAALDLEQQIQNVELKLAFPECKIDDPLPGAENLFLMKDLTNNIQAEFVPRAPSEAESSDIADDSLIFRLTTQPSGAGFAKYNSFNVITDTTAMRSSPYRWGIQFDNTESKEPLTNIEVKDFELDERLKIQTIRLGTGPTGNIKAIDRVERVDVVCDDKTTDTYYAEDFKDAPYEYGWGWYQELKLNPDKVYVEFSIVMKQDYGLKQNEQIHVGVYTTFRNPDDKHFQTDTDTAEQERKNTYVNKASVIYKDENNTYHTLTTQNAFLLIEAHENIRIDKGRSGPNPVQPEETEPTGSKDEAFWENKKEKEDDEETKGKYDATFWYFTISGALEDKAYEDMRIIDILPPGFIWKEGAYGTGGEYVKDYTVIENYKNSGQTAVILYLNADKVKEQLGAAKQEEGSTTIKENTVNISIKTKALERYTPLGTATNKVYLLSDDFYPVTTQPAEEDQYDLDNDGNTGEKIRMGMASVPIRSPMAIVAEKYIAPETGSWRKGMLNIDVRDKFRYQLRVTNLLSKNQKNLVVYDVLPRIGDKIINGKENRNSQYTVGLSAWIRPPEGYTVRYTDSQEVYNNKSMHDILTDVNITWYDQEHISQGEVTAFKIMAGENVEMPAKEAITFEIPVEVTDTNLPQEIHKDFLSKQESEDRPSGTATYLKAINSFGYAYGDSGNTANNKASNSVASQIPFAGFVIKKVDDENQTKPLRGAEFKLEKQSGDEGNEWEAVGSIVSSDDKGIVSFKNLTEGHYRLTETKAPEGYRISGDPIPVEITLNRTTMEYTITMGGNSESANGEQIAYTGSGNSGDPFVITNKVFYELPSTGGIGIYWYIISGILLMAGAALIVYKNRCREVLKR